MREANLYRGKREDTNAWVKGYHVVIGSIDMIVSTDGQFHKIIPETLGQYTGRHARGRVEIFEGDICQYPDCYSAAGEIEEVVSTGEVKWDEDHPSFYLTNSLGVEWHTIWEYAYEMTVVGNVHDNPGLLEY